MIQLKSIMRKILNNGEFKDTRTGQVRTIWKSTFEHDMSEGFPAVTSKKLAWNSVVGELLFFLSGEHTLSGLKHFTFGDESVDRWTIWTDDAERWGGKGKQSLGQHYGVQWRDYNRSGVDQIENLIHRLKKQPHRRDHIVMAWNPETIENDETALKPCHLGFQCYVTNEGKLNLNWWQRSWDMGLGSSFNVASYGLLLHLLCEWTGYEPGILSCDAGDVHIYENHISGCMEYLNNPTFGCPILEIPEQAKKGLDETLELTALDFEYSLIGYQHAGVIKMPLSVGKE